MKLLNLFSSFQKKQPLSIIDSWTVTWRVTDIDLYSNQFSKVFANKSDAKIYRRKLKKSATFLHTWIEISMYKN